MSDHDKQRARELKDFRRVLRHYRQNRREDMRQDLAVAWVRIAIADLEDRGVRLSSDEVAAMMHLDDASRAAEEIARDHLGHYPGKKV